MFDSAPPSLPTRDRLIQAAAELMMRQSYSTVSVDDICKAADIKKGTFYHHFPSKVELALVTFDHIWDECRCDLVACINDTAKTPEERLRAFADLVIAHHRETFAAEGKVYGCPLANAGNELGAQDDAVRNKIEGLFEDSIGLFASLVAEFPSHRTSTREQCLETARALVCMLMGVEYQAKIFNNPEVLARDLMSGFQRILAATHTETI